MDWSKIQKQDLDKPDKEYWNIVADNLAEVVVDTDIEIDPSEDSPHFDNPEDIAVVDDNIDPELFSEFLCYR